MSKKKKKETVSNSPREHGSSLSYLEDDRFGGKQLFRCPDSNAEKA